MKFDVEQF